MQINLENLVPITEANQNFSKVARMVDSKGTAVILKNNKPKYILIEYDTLVKANSEEMMIAEESSVEYIASSILSRHIEAFKELAK
ncbi:type II toxin-antitoxin system Phd/YefM family antitoxin [Aerococcaceae bacterium zg-B36]|uniref:type II toxin-antitoxin system Phd/YefM family antitoxin n=1 Tax=Aerococcaceae bacterium zg-252 TaxID=2796928 RepID=UPI001BD819F3|nr:type II toxin-antitoxin system Phd/YefM family antitoxin [Aerococcaceae bacterium zg-B36]